MARRTGRPRIIAAEGAFHGRTMGALALTGQPAKRAPFEPMPPGVEFVPYGDIPALRAAVDDTVAAVFLEPILGEAGVVPAPDGYLAAARSITAEHGALLVIDEVQTGIGRTGTWFAHTSVRHRPGHHHPGQGARRRAADRRRHRPRRRGAAAAARPARLAPSPATRCARPPRSPCCETIETDGLLDHVDALGQAHRHRRRGSRPPAGRPRPRCRAADRHRAHREHRPRQRLSPPGRPASSSTRRRPDVLRLAPPLILTTEQADSFVAALPADPGHRRHRPRHGKAS